MADGTYQQTRERLSSVVCLLLCTSWRWCFQRVADCCRKANIAYIRSVISAYEHAMHKISDSVLTVSWQTWHILIRNIIVHKIPHQMIKVLVNHMNITYITWCINKTLASLFKWFAFSDTLAGWQKSIWPVKNWVTGRGHGYLSAVRCRWLAYGPANANKATATPSPLASLKSRMVYPSSTNLPRLFWKKAVLLCFLLKCSSQSRLIGYLGKLRWIIRASFSWVGCLSWCSTTCWLPYSCEHKQNYQRKLLATYKRSKCSPQNNMSTLSLDVVRAYSVLSRQTSQKYLAISRHLSFKALIPVSYTHLTLPTKRIV